MTTYPFFNSNISETIYQPRDTPAKAIFHKTINDLIKSVNNSHELYI